MKVLQLIDTLDAGGAERMAVNLANAGSRYGIQSFLCATRKGGILENAVAPEVALTILNKKSVYDLKALQTLIKFIKEHDIEILHAHSTSIYTAFLVALRMPALKLVWHDHYGMSEFLQKRNSIILKIMKLRFSGVVACTRILRDWSQDILGFEKAIYIPNFVALSTDEIPVTKVLGAPGKRIVCLANLRPQKNHIVLLEAFRAIVAQYPDWTLHLVGKGFQDSYEEKIKATIKTFELEEKVFLYGSCPDVSSILKQMDMGVLFSLSEGLPLALLEYGMASLATVVNDVGLCSEVLGNTGIVMTDVNSQGYNSLKLFIDDTVLRDLQGKAFHNKVLEEFGVEQCLTQLKTLYTSL